jgi:hypothetical protein
MRAVSYFAAFVGGICVCFLLVSLGVVDKVDGIPGTQEEPMLSLPTYLSFLSVMLTAMTAVLAAVAIGIGVVAFYTFPGLKAEARIVAEKAAKDVSIEALAEIKIKAMVFDLYAKAEKEREQVTEWGEDPETSQER